MFKAKKANFYSFIAGGGGFALKHDGWAGCGIPDAGDTIVLTGGDGHNFVTRWVDQILFISYLLLFLAFMFVRCIFFQIVQLSKASLCLGWGGTPKDPRLKKPSNKYPWVYFS